MMDWDRPTMKRRASDSSQLEVDIVSGKRSRFAEVQRASSSSGLPGYTGSVVYSATQSSSNKTWTANQEQSFTSQIPTQGAVEVQSALPFSPDYNACCSPGWSSQLNVPGSSEISDQTMEAAPECSLQTPQRNVSKWEYDACDMSVDLPRSNSAPDLRILLNSFSNSLPLAPLEKLPVMGSGIATGAIVPYKAPQDVIRDAVLFQLRKQVDDAVQERHNNFGVSEDWVNRAGYPEGNDSGERQNAARETQIVPMDVSEF